MTVLREAADEPRLSPAAVRSAATYLHTWFAFRQHYLRVPGVQVAVLFGDELALSAAYGRADVEGDVALTDEHLIRVASHSKTFTATLVLQLVEAGKLRLDDEVGEWLPFLTEADSPLATLTLRELLNHSGGVVRDGEDADFWQLRQPFPDDDALREMALRNAAVLPVNERFKYSNIAYGLLGMVVAAASGRSYHDLVRASIVRPLNLDHTGPEFDVERADQYAVGYSALSYADRRVRIDHVDTRALAAATGIFSTATDLCRYAAAHFFGDERLLADSSKRLMQHEWWSVDDRDSAKTYGLGFSIITCGERQLVGHGGGYPGHITRTVFDPRERLAVAVLTNAIDAPAEELATAAVKLIDLAAKHEQPVEEGAGRFCGRFANLWGVRDIALLGGRLFLLNPALGDPSEDRSELRVEDARTLRVADGPGYGAAGEGISFDFAADGAINSLRGPGGMTSWPLTSFRLAEAGVTAAGG